VSRFVGLGRVVLVMLLAGCSVASPAPIAAVAVLTTPSAQSTPLAEEAVLAAPTIAPATPLPAAAPPPPAVATSTSDLAQSAQSAADTPCDDTVRNDPLPAPGSPRSQDFFRSFRALLAPAPLYDPPGQRHVDIAQRTAGLLQAAGVQVDVLPATVPQRYRANVFIALHADGDPAGRARGFKVARPGFSSLPEVDDRLVDTLNQAYATDTELPRDDEHISLRMRYYYAFNSRRYCHAVAPGVPQAIVEMGYLTSAVDRGFLIGDPDRLARGLADGIQVFLNTLP
jgi:N-acetylmuramoyl-L-alanine amidase